MEQKNSKYFAKLQMIIDKTKYSSNYFSKKKKFSILKIQIVENKRITENGYLRKFSKKKILHLSDEFKNMFYNINANNYGVILSFFELVCLYLQME